MKLNRDSASILFKTLRDRPPTKFERLFKLFYLLVGVLGALIFVISWINGSRPAVLFLFISAAYLLLWFYFHWQSCNERICAQKMLDFMDGNNNDLCWIYIEEERGARSTTLVHYLFCDRRHGSIVGKDQSAEELFEFLRSSFLELSTGWTPEYEKWFRRNPSDLKYHPHRGFERKITDIPADNPFNGW